MNSNEEYCYYPGDMIYARDLMFLDILKFERKPSNKYDMYAI